MNEDPPVRFDVVADPRYARLVRTALGALAALESFSVDRTDDLRLLVDEVFNALVCAGAPRITVEASPLGGAVHIVTRAVVSRSELSPTFDTVQRVADVIAPGFVLVVADGSAMFAATVGAAPD